MRIDGFEDLEEVFLYDDCDLEAYIISYEGDEVAKLVLESTPNGYCHAHVQFYGADVFGGGNDPGPALVSAANSFKFENFVGNNSEVLKIFIESLQRKDPDCYDEWERKLLKDGFSVELVYTEWDHGDSYEICSEFYQ